MHSTQTCGNILLVQFELIRLVFVTMPEFFENAVFDVYDIDEVQYLLPRKSTSVLAVQSW